MEASGERIIQPLLRFLFNTFILSESYFESFPTLFILSFFWILSMHDYTRCDRKIIDPNSTQFLLTFITSLISVGWSITTCLRKGPIKLLPPKKYGGLIFLFLSVSMNVFVKVLLPSLLLNNLLPTNGTNQLRHHEIFKHDYSKKFLYINRNSSSLFYYIILSKV